MIDTSTNTVTVASIGVGVNPEGIAITPDGRFAYVVNFGSGTVTVIDTSTNTVTVASIGVGPSPVGITITPDGRFAYVTNIISSDVTVIDTSTNTVTVASIAVGTSPLLIAITPDGRFAYVATANSNDVTVIDTSDNTVAVASIAAGTGTEAIAITPDGGFAYVTNTVSDDVTVIDTSTNTVTVPSITVGDRPRGIAIIPNPILHITTSTLPDGQVGVGYSFSVVAAGGVRSYTFSADPATLPPGLSMDANGLISGTPMAAGTFSFDVTVTDSAVPAESVTKTVTLEVPAVLIDSGTPPSLLSGGTGMVVFSDQTVVQQFTLPVDATITEIAPFMGRNTSGPDPVVKAHVTTAIGPATTTSEVVAEFAFTVSTLNPGATFEAVPTSFFLNAGTYFLVLSSSAELGNSAYWLIKAPIDIGPRFVAFSGNNNPAFPPASQFSSGAATSHGLRISGIPGSPP